MGGDTYTHAWWCCCHYYNGDRGCRINFCGCCCQAGDPKLNTEYRGKRITDCNGCGCCGIHAYDISDRPEKGLAGTNATTTTAPNTQTMSHANTNANSAPTVPPNAPAASTPATSNYTYPNAGNPNVNTAAPTNSKPGYEPGPVSG